MIEELENGFGNVKIKYMQTCNKIGRGSGGGDGKQKNVLVGYPTEKWNKRTIPVVEHQGMEIPKKSHLEEEENTQWLIGQRVSIWKN